MKKLSINDLVEFNRRTDRGKKSFVEKMKSDKVEAPLEGGGDYWITSLSAVCNSYKENNLNIIADKTMELQAKLSNSNRGITKNMYQRNIEILQQYLRMDLKNLRPDKQLTFLKKSTGNPTLNLSGLQIAAKPSHIFTFGKKEEERVGAIWFVAKVDEYRIDEVSMFCDIQYRFLKQNYSNQYQIAPKYCIAVDMLSRQALNYSEMDGGELAKVLTSTLDEIKKLM